MSAATGPRASQSDRLARSGLHQHPHHSNQSMSGWTNRGFQHQEINNNNNSAINNTLGSYSNMSTRPSSTTTTTTTSVSDSPYFLTNDFNCDDIPPPPTSPTPDVLYNTVPSNHNINPVQPNDITRQSNDNMQTKNNNEVNGSAHEIDFPRSFVEMNYSPDTPLADDFTSYDIPLESRLPHQMHKGLSSIKTTNFINETISSNDERYENDPSDSDALSHGFFFGSNSVPNLFESEKKDQGSDTNMSDGEEDQDEGISEFYRPSGDPDMWIRQSYRSNFKPSPEVTPRHVISQRIGNIGGFGQNIGLGHHLGVLTEDATLIPKRVILDSTNFVIEEDSPMQTDVKWAKPDNAEMFSSLVYKVEADFPGSEDSWVELTSVRHPTFRIYHTDDKMFVGKYHVMRRNDDVTIKLRVCSHGEIILPERYRHWTVSSYSTEIKVTFAGYASRPLPLQSTSL